MKETPADAEARSHILMLRAGMIRQLGSGTYSYLPLGMRSLLKVVHIIREEMNRAGALEILMPALWPMELLDQTGRLEVFGADLMKFTDRRDRPHVLAPTHEEVVTQIVRDNLKSYRQLPVNLYQIQTKFRDEPRPRFGVVRTREFIMKDAYSFDMDVEGLERSYQAMYEAYCRIFERCALPFQVVEATSGAMGGGASHEFMVACEVGSDRYVRCTQCGYAANVQKAEVPPPESRPEPNGKAELKVVETPGKTTIEQVSEFLNTAPVKMIKTLIFRADCGPVAALVRGDHEINETKLAAALGTMSLEMADEAMIEQVTGAPVGFAGPVGLSGVKIVSDYSVALVRDGVTGANRRDAHMLGVTPGRDFEADLEADIRVVTPDDPCPRCRSGLLMENCIEVGHVFKLGTKYSEALGATYQGSDGEERPYVMGCYGIGVSRILAAAIEASSDDKGIVWSPALAPYEAVVLHLDLQEEKIAEGAEQAYQELLSKGIDVLLDDRAEQPGVKFKDAELIGFPLAVVVGKRYLRSGKFEVQTRRDGSKLEVEPGQLAGTVERILKES